MTLNSGNAAQLVNTGVVLSPASQQWQAGIVTNTDTTEIIINSKTLTLANRSPTTIMGNPGTVAAKPSDINIGAGLSLSTAGTLSATGTNYISAVDSRFAVTSGTLANVAAGTLFGNSGTVSAEPSGTIAIGSGLSLSTAGTLANSGIVSLVAGTNVSITGGNTISSSNPGGTVTKVVGGPGTTGGTITTSGTISGLFQAGTVTALGENIAINSGTIVSNQPVVTITGTTTAAVGDRGKLFVANSTAAVSLVLPGSIDANGWSAEVINVNTGILTLTPGTGVVLNNTPTATGLQIPEFTSAKIVNDGGTNWYTPPGLEYWQPGAGQVIALGSGMLLSSGTLSASGSGASGAFGPAFGILGAAATTSGTGLINNLGTASPTVTNTSAGIFFKNTGGGVGAYTNAVPSTPYTVTACLCSYPGGSVPALGWANGSGALEVIHLESGNTRVSCWNNIDSFNSEPFSAAMGQLNNIIFFRVHDDGTNVSFSMSLDGVNFDTVYTVAKASGFLGASGYSHLFAGGVGGSGATLMNWLVTQP